MRTHETSEQSRSFLKMLFWSGVAIILLPFFYLFTLALLLSAYAHGYRLPTRSFLKAYGAPSNVLVTDAPGARVFAPYWQFCVRVTGADYNNEPRNQ